MCWDTIHEVADIAKAGLNRIGTTPRSASASSVTVVRR